MSMDMTVFIPDLTAKNKGGRAQSVIRDLFQPFYVNDRLIGPEKDRLNNVSSYACKSCKQLVDGNKLSLLKLHVLMCARMDRKRRGMPLSVSHTNELYFVHMPLNNGWLNACNIENIYTQPCVCVIYRFRNEMDG